MTEQIDAAFGWGSEMKVSFKLSENAKKYLK